MKCQYCGGDISLEDRICPHCGRLQENAVRHDEEMKRYEAAFEDTISGLKAVIVIGKSPFQ